MRGVSLVGRAVVAGVGSFLAAIGPLGWAIGAFLVAATAVAVVGKVLYDRAVSNVHKTIEMVVGNERRVDKTLQGIRPGSSEDPNRSDFVDTPHYDDSLQGIRPGGPSDPYRDPWNQYIYQTSWQGNVPWARRPGRDLTMTEVFRLNPVLSF